MKSTTTINEKKTKRYCLSWQPDGRCGNLTRKAIIATAPATSGVYGLYNLDCQVFIGESENIQEALLRHIRETDFQSQHLRPTGFAYETCPAESRKSKANALIARFHPLLQTQAELMQGSTEPMTSEVSINRTHGSALPKIFVVNAVVIFCLGIPLAPNQSAELTPAKTHVQTSAPTPNIAVALEPNTVDRAPTTAPEGLAKTGAHMNKNWSVQVSAVPSKEIADTSAQRLKAKGFDGYVVPAVIKGRTYYRVRVGRFDAREEAESMRQLLTRQGAYRDAYLTDD